MRPLRSSSFLIALCLGAGPGCDEASPSKPTLAERDPAPKTNVDDAPAPPAEAPEPVDAKPAAREAKPDDPDAASDAQTADLPRPEEEARALIGPSTQETWRPTGPFASVSFEAGALQVEPKKAGDGELPHEPSKNVDPDVGTFMDHLTKFGWSGDGKTFAYCSVGGGECNQCTFVALDGSQSSQCEEEEPQRWAREKFGKGPLKWAHGGDVTLQWEAVENTKVGGQDLTIFAKVQGSDAKAEMTRMTLADLDDKGMAFPEVVSLSSDGTKLAILGHGWQGEGTDELVPRLLDTGTVAAEAYNAAGLALLKAGKNEEAVERFLQASVAAPHLWKGPYNAACAYAKLDDRRAQSTLHEAVRRGGEDVKAKAKRDSDLEAVRKKDWYTSLIGT